MKLLRRPGSTVPGSTAVGADIVLGGSGPTEAEADALPVDAAELVTVAAIAAEGGAETAVPPGAAPTLETTPWRSASSSSAVSRYPGSGSTTVARGIGVGLAPNM